MPYQEIIKYLMFNEEDPEGRQSFQRHKANIEKEISEIVQRYENPEESPERDRYIELMRQLNFTENQERISEYLGSGNTLCMHDTDGNIFLFALGMNVREKAMKDIADYRARCNDSLVAYS